MPRLPEGVEGGRGVELEGGGGWGGGSGKRNLNGTFGKKQCEINVFCVGHFRLREGEKSLRSSKIEHVPRTLIFERSRRVRS